MVNGFGFSTLDTLLLQMIAFGAQGLFCIISAIGCTYLPNTRTYFMVFNTVMSLIGTVMIRQIDHASIWARFAGYCLTIAFSANYPLILATITSNIAGFSKKATATAIVSYRATLSGIVTREINTSIQYRCLLPTAPGTSSGLKSCSLGKHQAILLDLRGF